MKMLGYDYVPNFRRSRFRLSILLCVLTFLFLLSPQLAWAVGSQSVWATPPNAPVLTHGPKQQVVPGSLYIIGWSKGGKMAAALVQKQEAAGFVEIRLSIRSMVTDKIVAELRSESHKDLKSFWRANKRQIAALLTRHKISKKTQKNLLALPIRIGTAQLRLDIQHIKQEPRDDSTLTIAGVLQKTRVKIVANSDCKTKKVIFDKMFSIPVRVFALGYLQSPFEPRISLVLAYQTPGQHGTSPHYQHYEFVGIHLKRGFR